MGEFLDRLKAQYRGSHAPSSNVRDTKNSVLHLTTEQSNDLIKRFEYLQSVEKDFEKKVLEYKIFPEIRDSVLDFCASVRFFSSESLKALESNLLDKEDNLNKNFLEFNAIYKNFKNETSNKTDFIFTTLDRIVNKFNELGFDNQQRTP